MKQVEPNKFIVCGMPFLKSKFDDLEGKTVVCFAEDSGIANPFQVRISKAGMKFKGEMQGEIYSEDDVQSLAQFMSVWVEELRKLRVKFAKTLSGH